MQPRIYPYVDISKFIFALCIVCIHANMWQGLLVYPLFFRLAVPYFFVASGFFLGVKIYSDGVIGGVDAWRKTLRRLVVKLIVFEPISLVLVWILLYRNATPLTEIIVHTVQGILFYPWGALWYIQALIVAILILIPFIRLGKEFVALLIGVALYIPALLCNSYYFLIEGTVAQHVADRYMALFVSPRNGLLVGLIFVVAGLLIAKFQSVIAGQVKLIYWLLAGCFILLFAEAMSIRGQHWIDDGGLMFTYILAVPVLFLFTINLSAKNHPPPWVRPVLLRNLSTSVYLIHRPVLMIVMWGFNALFYHRLVPWFGVAVTLAIVLTICGIIYPKKIQPFYNWLR